MPALEGRYGAKGERTDMRQKHWGRRLAAGLLLGAAAFALAGCGLSGGAGSGAEDLALFEIHPMEGYERADGTFEVQDASGQTICAPAILSSADKTLTVPSISSSARAFPRAATGNIETL